MRPGSTCLDLISLRVVNRHCPRPSSASASTRPMQPHPTGLPLSLLPLVTVWRPGSEWESGYRVAPRWTFGTGQGEPVPSSIPLTLFTLGASFCWWGGVWWRQRW